MALFCWFSKVARIYQHQWSKWRGRCRISLHHDLCFLGICLPFPWCEMVENIFNQDAIFLALSVLTTFCRFSFGKLKQRPAASFVAILLLCFTFFICKLSCPCFGFWAHKNLLAHNCATIDATMAIHTTRHYHSLAEWFAALLVAISILSGYLLHCSSVFWLNTLSMFPRRYLVLFDWLKTKPALRAKSRLYHVIFLGTCFFVLLLVS